VLARLLAIRIVVLTLRSPLESFRLAFKILFASLGDVLIWGLEWLLISAALIAPTILVKSPWWMIASSLLWYALLVFNLGFWTACYHSLVGRVEPGTRQHLMTGRRPSPDTDRLIWTTIILLAVGLASMAAWYFRVSIADIVTPLTQNL